MPVPEKTPISETRVAPTQVQIRDRLNRQRKSDTGVTAPKVRLNLAELTSPGLPALF
jgi:hypothetical protein